MSVLFDPKCAEAYNNLGVIYKDRGNLDQAIVRTLYTNITSCILLTSLTMSFMCLCDISALL